MTRKIIYRLGRWRARGILSRILPMLEKSQKIIDIGSGTCNVAELLIKSGKKVTPLDVRNLSFVPGIVPVIYDGKKIPFADNSFDAALLICCLHHTKNPESLLKEAKRVAGKIIVLEDVYSNKKQKLLTHFFDNLLNLNFSGNPHSNRTDIEWREIFASFNLNIERSERYSSLFIFHHVLYKLLPLPR